MLEVWFWNKLGEFVFYDSWTIDEEHWAIRDQQFLEYKIGCSAVIIRKGG